MNAADSLSIPSVATTLDRLHRAARGDVRRAIAVLPRVLWGLLRGRALMTILRPADLATAYIPVSREQGRLLYALARSSGARRIVEFGASFGVSTIYLAAAARDNGDGLVLTTEIEPNKCRATEANLGEAGLAAHARVLEGDARETLRDIDGPIDLVFLDGWKDLYVDVLDLVRPHLKRGALIIADNVNFKDARSYVDRVRAGGEFVSTSLFRGRTEITCFVGQFTADGARHPEGSVL